MHRFASSFLKSAVLGTALLAAGSSATNYSLWVKGRGAGGDPSNRLDFRYWGPGDRLAGVNKRSINWDGASRISTQSGMVRDALDCYCTGPNWCYIAAYSAGDLMMGYTLAYYGNTTRTAKVPDSSDGSGVCTNADKPARKQTGWNIKWIAVAAGAAGGTELADAGASFSEPLVADLKTSTARALYNHNVTANVEFRMFAGARGSINSVLLPGQDDEVVAYHSSGGVSGSSGASFCNPGDWFCNDLTLGTATNQGGRAKWSYHSVVLRDDSESFNHYLNGDWGGVDGIVSKVRAHMATNAY